MSARQRPHPFIRALQNKLPDAVITISRQQHWHSLTFAGERLEFYISLSGMDAATRMRTLAQQLPDEQFTLPSMLVADLTVTRTNADTQSAILSAEVLVLEE